MIFKSFYFENDKYSNINNICSTLNYFLQSLARGSMFDYWHGEANYSLSTTNCQVPRTNWVIRANERQRVDGTFQTFTANEN